LILVVITGYVIMQYGWMKGLL